MWRRLSRCSGRCRCHTSLGVDRVLGGEVTLGVPGFGPEVIMEDDGTSVSVRRATFDVIGGFVVLGQDNPGLAGVTDDEALGLGET